MVNRSKKVKEALQRLLKNLEWCGDICFLIAEKPKALLELGLDSNVLDNILTQISIDKQTIKKDREKRNFG